MHNNVGYCEWPSLATGWILSWLWMNWEIGRSKVTGISIFGQMYDPPSWCFLANSGFFLFSWRQYLSQFCSSSVCVRNVSIWTMLLSFAVPREPRWVPAVNRCNSGNCCCRPTNERMTAFSWAQQDHLSVLRKVFLPLFSGGKECMPTWYRVVLFFEINLSNVTILILNVIASSQW